MALPTPDKTWEFDVNHVAITTEEELAFQIKNKLVGNGVTSFTAPLTVLQSSDATSSAASDLWLNSGDCVFNNEGSAHSWIVFDMSNIVAGAELCWNLIDNPGGGPDAQEFFWSQSDGFTGGTTTNRPTATDEVTLDAGVPLIANGGNLATTSARLHVAMSNDGQVVRWWIYKGGIIVSFIDFQVPRNPASLWTNPWVATVVPQYYNTGADTNQTTFSLLAIQGTPSRVYSAPLGITANLRYTGEASEGATGTAEEFLGILQQFPNDLEPGQCFPIFPVGLWSNTVGVRGRIGEVSDIWWGSTVVSNGSHYPSDGTNTFVQLADIVVPWVGGGVQMATV